MPEGQGRRRWWAMFWELVGLTGIALVQPMLDLTGKNAEVLVVHDVTWIEALGLALVLALAVPVCALVVLRLVAVRFPRAVAPLHAAFGALLVGVFAVQLAEHATDWTRIGLAVVGAAAAAVGGLLLLRSAAVRAAARLLSVAALAFVVMFLFASPATAVLFGRRSAVGSGTAPTRPVRVVMVVFDELPTASLLDGKGGVDASLYPNFGDLADHSTWYRNNTTVAAFTAGAVPAILTGRYPKDQHALPILDQYPENIFTTFAQTRVNARESVTHLCPSSVCPPSGQRGLVSLTSAVTDLWWRSVTSRTTPRPVDTQRARGSVDRADEFVASLRRAPGPGLDFVHLELPHYPWERLPSRQRYAVPERPVGESYSLTPPGPGATSARMRHLLQVQATDTVLGRIVGRLRALGLYDGSMIVVTADHGVGTKPGLPVRNPAIGNLDQVMWSPLFVKYPGEASGEVDDRPSETVDILPTIADVVGARLPAGTDGTSLLRPVPARTTRRLYPWVWLRSPLDAVPTNSGGYLVVPGEQLFRKVLTESATPAGGDPTLRIYRTPPYGGLVGTEVPPGVDRAAGGATASIRDPGRFRRVDLDAPVLDWVYNEGEVRGIDVPGWIAVALDRRIAAVVATGRPVGGRARFSFLVPPSLVHAGRHRLTAYVVTGAGTAPRLAQVPLR